MPPICSPSSLVEGVAADITSAALASKIDPLAREDNPVPPFTTEFCPSTVLLKSIDFKNPDVTLLQLFKSIPASSKVNTILLAAVVRVYSSSRISL